MEAEIFEKAIGWRRHLHANPELAYEERETQAFIARKMSEWGYDVHTGLGKTGLVARMQKGTSRKTIGIRADMDALPLTEATGLSWQSKKPGLMHGCGHDGHVAMALAAANLLAARGNWDGTICFVFQPGEESHAGARAMVHDGLFKRFPMDAIYACHNWPGLAFGKMVARDDAMMAAVATFSITIKGQGAHGAMPHQGHDPVMAAAHIITALQTVVSRNISPLESAVISVTKMQAAETWNVISETAHLGGTVRWFHDDIGDLLERRIGEIADMVAGAFSCTAELCYQRRYPATINDPAHAAFLRQIAPLVGLEIAELLPSTGAEDFSYMLAQCPGCYFWLGAARTAHDPGLHSPRFDFNDQLIPYGAKLWETLVLFALGTS